MQSGWVQDADVTASSMKDLVHDPGMARLHSNGAWMPFIHDVNQFLQIHFQDETSILQVATQGHPIEDYWVTQYSLASSMDATLWEEIPEVRARARVLPLCANADLIQNCLRNSSVLAQLSLPKPKFEPHY